MKLITPSLAALALALCCSCGKKNDITLLTAPAEMRDLSTSVTATGTIEPVTSVTVGTQVSGIIDKIFVDYNTVVHKGDIIAELDKTNLLSELSNARSSMANAKSNLEYQQANYERYKTLYEKGLVAANDYEVARLSYQQARQQLAIEEQNVAKAQTNLGYATITAPIDGVVLSKEVEEGQTVAAQMTTPTLFVIARDLTDMRVIADVDEADIGEVRQGQRVTFTVDAYPDDVFEGTVTQVRQEATTESNVVTYEVVISAPNDDLKLKPGLTANVTIYTMERDHVLCVPSKALKYMPSEPAVPKGDSIVGCSAPERVWVEEGKSIRAIPVTTGMAGGAYTEITSGLREGQRVIVGASAGTETPEAAEDNNPFMPKPPSARNSKDKKEEAPR